jgi:hypothetical protein
MLLATLQVLGLAVLVTGGGPLQPTSFEHERRLHAGDVIEGRGEGWRVCCCRAGVHDPVYRALEGCAP